MVAGREEAGNLTRMPSKKLESAPANKAVGNRAFGGGAPHPVAGSVERVARRHVRFIISIFMAAVTNS